MKDWRYILAEQRGTLLALALFLLMFTIYVTNHPAGFTPNVVTTAANKGVILALVAMAQCFVVLTAGIDLSVGMVFILANCLGSYIIAGSAIEITLGLIGVMAAGAACGALNGLIVIYGRLQPIVTTIATGAIFFGIALWLRPYPGSEPDFAADLADALTGKLFDTVPASLVFLAGVIVVVWIPFRRSLIGRTVYAVGSSDQAAYMSGLPVRLGRFSAFVLSGFLASLGGIFLTFITYSGEASLANGDNYTLFSIASVVLGGVSLYGGRGSAVGAIFGALAFRAIGDLLFVFDLDPLWQPLFQGIVLGLAVTLGAARLFQVRNRLELFN
ncbi:MAG: ABC transporter permease [Salaquimonas sp.]|jgi:ribose transport system permease protein|nr:ABC transporter permease [Salaquimonas sp.]